MIHTPYELNLRHLRALLDVQDGGSISAGSRSACLSQSALTQAIAKLEKQLACVLFDRHVDGVNVTSTGEQALQRVRAALTHLDDGVGRIGCDVGPFRRALSMHHVRALLALADARSFASASLVAGLPQSTVHRAIGELEGRLDKRLVERRSTGTLLSFNGRRIARGFRLAINELRAMIGELGDDGIVVPVSIGALPIARPFIVPTAIARMAGQYDRVRFSVAEGEWHDLVDQLQDGVIDLIVGTVRDDGMPELTQQRFADDDVAILCGSHHPLAAHPCPSMEALASYPWIVGPPRTPLRQQWESLFANRPLPVAPVECESVMIVINLLAQGPFLTLASPRQVELPLQMKRLARVGGAIAGSTSPVGVITRKSWRPTAIEQRFMQTIADVARNGGAAPIAVGHHHPPAVLRLA